MSKRHYGRPITSEVHNFFELSENKEEYKCKVQGCTGVYKNKHAGTFKKHLKSFHPEEYCQVLLSEDAIQQSKTDARNTRTGKISITMSAETLKMACVTAVTIDGRPFKHMEDKSFRMIIDPILAALKPEDRFTVSRESVYDFVKLAAIDMREQITEELKEIPLISIKLDIGSRHNRSFLGVNIQFIRDGAVHLRTLAVKELVSSHTGLHLRDVVLEILNNYNVSVDRIYSLTSDNGSNMIKLNELLENDQELLFNDGNEAIDEDDDNTTDHSSEDENDPTNKNEEIINSLFDFFYSAILKLVRCGLHTLQLAVTDVLKDESIKRAISKAREAVKTLRTDSYLKMLRGYNIRKPVLDVNTRWNSTADMLSSLLSAKRFCQDFAPSKIQFRLLELEWTQIEDLLAALLPCKIATLHLQKENLLPGDFFGIWRECRRRTELITSELAKKLFESIKRREEVLLQNEALLAAMFMDPRYLAFLDKNQCIIAKEVLRKIWLALQVNNDTRNVENHSNESRNADEIMPLQHEDCPDILDLERNRLDEERRKDFPISTNRSITQLLSEFEKIRSIPLKENVLYFWECNKLRYPELYKLSKIVLAVPMTQVSVERLFSGMRYIFSTLRANLSQDIIDDILIVRTNDNFIHKIQAKPSEPKKIRLESNVNEDTSCSSTELMSENSQFS